MVRVCGDRRYRRTCVPSGPSAITSLRPMGRWLSLQHHITGGILGIITAPSTSTFPFCVVIRLAKTPAHSHFDDGSADRTGSLKLITRPPVATGEEALQIYYCRDERLLLLRDEYRRQSAVWLVGPADGCTRGVVRSSEGSVPVLSSLRTSGRATAVTSADAVQIGQKCRRGGRKAASALPGFLFWK